MPFCCKRTAIFVIKKEREIFLRKLVGLEGHIKKVSYSKRQKKEICLLNKRPRTQKTHQKSNKNGQSLIQGLEIAEAG